MAPPSEVRRQVGAVTIGRNEGARLQRCLESIIGGAGEVVYVDSGSTDDSVAIARRLGVHVVLLDMSSPFTAARARNEGFRALQELRPDLPYAQFVDGDCEVAGRWLATAAAFLEARPDVAIVCGRRRERHPERSVYNAMCDIEWDTPLGDSAACGGDAMVRADAFRQAGQFRADLIAGEEPELCVRLRALGWRIWRLPDEMTIHDAAMTRFAQWWRRTVRAGYAFAEGATMHSPQQHWSKESRSIRIWAFWIPASIAGLAILWDAWALLGFAAYPLQIIRLALSGRRSSRENWYYAAFLVLGKFAEAVGQARFFYRRYRGAPPRLIEYK